MGRRRHSISEDGPGRPLPQSRCAGLLGRKTANFDHEANRKPFAGWLIIMDAANEKPRDGRQFRGGAWENIRNGKPHYTPSATIASPVDLILSRLDGVRQTGPGKWLARCPAHEDRSPSLSIRETDDCRVLIHDFAGCSVDSICAAIGLEVADLFPRTHGRDFDPTAPRPKPPRFQVGELLPLVVTEATILALAWRTLADGGLLSEADRERAELAHEAVMAAFEEVRRG